MKRVLATALLVWYATLATGFYVHVHYCCGNLAGVEINYASVQDDTCCGSQHDACSMETACCSFDNFYVALEDAHNPVSFDFEVSSVPYQPQLSGNSLTSHEGQNTFLDDRANPKTGPPLFRLYCSPQHYS